MSQNMSEECEELLRKVTRCYLEKTFEKYFGTCRKLKRRFNELCSIETLEEYPNVRERYYQQLYCKRDVIQSDHCVLLHSNKICLITLAESHPVVKDKKRIKKLDFQISDKLDRLENKVVGKSKKGAQYIQPDSILCFVECEDGCKYPVYGCIQGKLIEVNESLINDYSLLSEKPLDGGYIAIIMPSKKDFISKMENFVGIDKSKESSSHSSGFSC